MEKVNNYKYIVKEVQEEIANLSSKPTAVIQTQIIQDDRRGQYLIYSNGWYSISHNRAYGCYFHIEVKDDGRVWLHHDGTDLVIAEMLEERGIPKEDIVLAFHAPIRRPDTGYAVA